MLIFGWKSNAYCSFVNTAAYLAMASSTTAFRDLQRTSFMLPKDLNELALKKAVAADCSRSDVLRRWLRAGAKADLAAH